MTLDEYVEKKYPDFSKQILEKEKAIKDKTILTGAYYAEFCIEKWSLKSVADLFYLLKYCFAHGVRAEFMPHTLNNWHAYPLPIEPTPPDDKKE